MVFHGRFGRVLNLLQIHLEQLGQRGCRHAAGAANFGLATTLRAANGGVCLDDVADNPARCERVEHFRVGEPCFSCIYRSTAGTTPLAPQVGAVTTTPPPRSVR